MEEREMKREREKEIPILEVFPFFSFLFLKNNTLVHVGQFVLQLEHKRFCQVGKERIVI